MDTVLNQADWYQVLELRAEIETLAVSAHLKEYLWGSCVAGKVVQQEQSCICYTADIVQAGLASFASGHNEKAASEPG